MNDASRAGVVTRVATMWLTGQAIEGIATDTGLDYDTVRKYLDLARQGWVKDVADPEAARAELVTTCQRVRRYALARMQGEKQRSADRVGWGKLALSAVNTELEVRGLRQITVSPSQSFIAALRRLSGTPAPAGPVPALDALDPQVVEGAVREIEAAEVPSSS